MSKFNWQEIKHRADGSWPQILSSLAGLNDKQLRNKHGPCPNCGGTDRYRFDDKQGTGSHFCSQCGAGDGIDLLVKCSGMQFGDAVDAIGDYLMLDASDQKRVYVAPKKINKIVSTRKNDNTDTTKAAKWMGMANYEPMSGYHARHRIKSQLWITFDREIVWTIYRAGGVVNAFIKCADSEFYAAGGMTNGGYHRINEDQGKSVFFCVNIIDAHLTAQFTGCECVCVFEYANLSDARLQYIEDQSPDKALFMAANNNETELMLAENDYILVILPIDSLDIATSSGFHKKLFNPTEVLDNGL